MVVLDENSRQFSFNLILTTEINNLIKNIFDVVGHRRNIS
jgi:hypothetical protein